MPGLLFGRDGLREADEIAFLNHGLIHYLGAMSRNLRCSVSLGIDLRRDSNRTGCEQDQAESRKDSWHTTFFAAQTIDWIGGSTPILARRRFEDVRPFANARGFEH